MNTQEKIYFDALSKDRAESADTLEKPSMRGIKNSVVEKYSDQAHFIYELLQNADDAQAENARFILEENRLVFAHDGTRHFSVSDPLKEEEDTENETLGDINSITSIANSNKTQASIGKFGVGFKAVFQYTSTPHIYDPNFKFKIERFLVPIELDKDFPGRRPQETLFVFPFDHQERNAEESYKDISSKLLNLSYPLLFLTQLKNIEFEFKNIIGLYGKLIKKTYSFGETTAEKICLMHNAGNEIYEEDLWLLSRLDECNRRYSIGYFIDKDGHLRAVDEPAFCFFPTKEVTGLKFILHAPFLLTDSREGIRAGVTHNEKMIKRLAELAADAMVYLRDIGLDGSNLLIDDNTVNIIPIDPKDFSNPANKSKVSFLPFYKAIKTRFETDELIPSVTGYVKTENAYWAAVSQLPQLFSNEQLAEIVDNESAQWAFVSLARDEIQRNNRPLFDYIESIVRTNLNEDAIINGRNRGFYYDRVLGAKHTLENIRGITSAYIEKQTIDWLHEFYKWLSETKHRTEAVTQKSIFLNQNSKAVAAFDKEEQSILFLPVEGVEGYTVVHPELLKNTDTKKFIDQIGIKQPSLRDQIYNIILPQYVDGAAIDTAPHFILFFKYYCKCSNENVDDFVERIKDYKFLIYYDEKGKGFREKASELYMPSAELKAYFETKPSVHFVALDEYKELVGPASEKQLYSFLTDIGIRKNIEILSQRVSFWSSGRKDLPLRHSTRDITWSEQVIDGCKEIVEYIHENHDESKSLILWNALLKIIETKCSQWWSITNLLRGTMQYFYYTFKYEYFISSDAILLREKSWIKTVEGEFMAPCELHKDSFADFYDTMSPYAEQLMRFLGVQSQSSADDDEGDDTYLTDAQREKIEFANKLKAMGITEDDFEEFQEFKRQKETRRHAEEWHSEGHEGGLSPDNSRESGVGTSDNDYLDDFDEDDYEKDTRLSCVDRKNLDKTTSRVVKDIVKRTKNKPTTPELSSSSKEDEDPDIDQDEYTPAPIDYSKRIEKAKQKSAAEIDKIAYFEELQASALKAPKYSYAWFTALLEMESINSGEADAHSKEVSISFAKVEKEPGTKRTLVLRHPDRYIPQFMEDLADIPLILHMGEQTKTVAIEVANIKSYTLRVKMKNGADIDGIDLSTVTSATIDAKSPAFLIEELRKQFAKLGEDNSFSDDYNMRENLCENIEFVFGPPGTGKTTYLAKNVLIPMMQKNAECKVLVLTPTNKSADVLVRRIMEVSHDTTYNKWLVRFGATSDEDIEHSPVFRDKTFDIRTIKKHVTVTTIARFPYDFFMPEGSRIFLNGINWDYIIIDEASMIPIANIVYPLYKKAPHKFIIAGDPFQIEPITSVDIWKNENIYTLVKLESFANPQTVPYNYKVELLTTQYRSVPDIGYVFSNFAYGGILQNYRRADSQRPLNVGNDLGVETLNIIKFPVSKYESIYRCKRLQHSSSYQVYSALFTFEYVCYLSRAIAENNMGSKFNIGVIAPYRAQADMIDKLLASEKLPDEIDVQVGTIHGFQGDECDIIFAVFNTPPSISSSPEMFLNKRNIVNVSISRARDYLFVVMPDDKTENITNLRLVRRVESLMHRTDAWNEFLSPDLEDMMFGDSKYLENNAFSTSHQSVNVYGLPEKCYEVRTEDSAIDVQIHRNAGSNVAKEVLKSSARDTKTSAFDEPDSLDENLIPKELKKDAIDLPVRGALNGWCYLVPYNGKLKTHTAKKAVGMFVPQMRNGEEKMVSVSVVKEDRIIYMSKDMFKLYERGLSEPDGIELRRTLLG